MNPPMTYFRNHPEPFYADWKGEPVPGWGVRPVMAGPARVGVGASSYVATQSPAASSIQPSAQEQFRASQARIAAQSSSDGGLDSSAGGGVPWWAWPLGAAAVLSGVGYLGVKQGWL